MTGKQVLRSLQIRNLLSFGDATEPLELLPLNVLIGPNGSGKSNLLTVLDLLHHAPTGLSLPIIKQGGDFGDWLWKGPALPRTATLELRLTNLLTETPIRYLLSLTAAGGPMAHVVAETIARDTESPLASPGLFPSDQDLHSYYSCAKGKAVIFADGQWRDWTPSQFDRTQSILSQLKDPVGQEELTFLGATLQCSMVFHRAWTLGPAAGVRQAQPANLDNDLLRENSENLGLVLNRMRQTAELKRRMLDYVQILFDGAADVDVKVLNNTVQVFMEERSLHAGIPASRLSDGTLRWLSLLALLLDSRPLATVVCIEEPELGLHPDLLPKVAELLVDASQRMQLIVTTHSEILVDALTHIPEAVVVCEKENGATTMRRLERERLKEWLKKYTLGQLWRKGQIGGNRW